MIRVAILLPLLFAALPAQAQSVAAQAGADALSRRCRAAGGTPREAAGLTRAIALSGRAAAALDAQRFSCAGAAAVDCGPFGCKLSIYFGGPVAVFETYVKAWRVRAGRLDILRVGAYCAGPGESCSETYQVTGDALTLVGKGEAKFASDPPPRPAVAARVSQPPARAGNSRSRLAARGVLAQGVLAQGVLARGRGKTAPKGEPAGRASTRGTFDGPAGASAAAVEAQSAPPAAPGVAAERRRKLDAAPYVP